MITIKNISKNKLSASGIVEWDDIFNPPVVGKMYVVYSHTDVSTNALRSNKSDDEKLCYTDDENELNGGISGNMDSNCRRFNGWRGTTDDIYVSAHGLRKCISVKTRIYNENEYNERTRYWIMFGENKEPND